MSTRPTRRCRQSCETDPQWNIVYRPLYKRYTSQGTNDRPFPFWFSRNRVGIFPCNSVNYNLQHRRVYAAVVRPVSYHFRAAKQVVIPPNIEMIVPAPTLQAGLHYFSPRSDYIMIKYWKALHCVAKATLTSCLRHPNAPTASIRICRSPA